MVGPSRLFMSFWRYAGAFANLKETFRYSYFPKGNGMVVLGIEVSLRGTWWYPAQRSKVKNYCMPLNFKKMSLTLGMSQTSG